MGGDAVPGRDGGDVSGRCQLQQLTGICSAAGRHESVTVLTMASTTQVYGSQQTDGNAVCWCDVHCLAVDGRTPLAVRHISQCACQSLGGTADVEVTIIDRTVQ